ncbi:OLC1v1012887C1 [Oldenlandia corymbosa var. corymbosa]|uniref:OLC1v1012887C1 n=1 Tax=Oldenlandia corymbosa var. corymbosa TaxID=529605 RepID=A0AAV1DX85_OLDCO|nr:OLC1v1012887C1 [Oldenlandia corymbosa var. corymbosa]
MAVEDVVVFDSPTEGTFHTPHSQFVSNDYQGTFQGYSTALEMPDSFYLIPVPPPENALENMDYIPIIGREKVLSPVSQSSSSIANPQSPPRNSHVADSFQETQEYYSTARKHSRSAKHAFKTAQPPKNKASGWTISAPLLEDESDAYSGTTFDTHMMKVRKCTSNTDAGTQHKKDILLRYNTRKCQHGRTRGHRKSNKVAKKSNASNSGPWLMTVGMDFQLSSDSDASSGSKKRSPGRSQEEEDRPQKKQNPYSEAHSQLRDQAIGDDDRMIEGEVERLVVVEPHQLPSLE